MGVETRIRPVAACWQEVVPQPVGLFNLDPRGSKYLIIKELGLRTTSIMAFGTQVLHNEVSGSSVVLDLLPNIS